MWDELKHNSLVKSYFPDYPPSKVPNANYFYKVKYLINNLYQVVNTLYPESITEFLQHALEIRNVKKTDPTEL